jgi:hypothetical protein
LKKRDGKKKSKAWHKIKKYRRTKTEKERLKKHHRRREMGENTPTSSIADGRVRFTRHHPVNRAIQYNSFEHPLGIGPEYRTKGIECLIESALYFTMSFDE